jgi:hypothetical protein
MFLFVPLSVMANLRLSNINDVKSRASQDVVFSGNDSCKYYGNTKNANSLGGVIVARRVCHGQSQNLKARAYLIELKKIGTVVPLIPEGSVWILKCDTGKSSKTARKRPCLQ